MATVESSVERDLYIALIRRFPLRPIRSAEELDLATEVIDDLVGRPSLSPAERDYLDILSDLTERYEAAEHPLPSASNADVIRFLMSAHELNQAALAGATGIPTSTLSEILSGKRGLSKGNIAALAAYFKVSTSTFRLD